MKRTIRMLIRRASQGAVLFLLLAVCFATAAMAQGEPIATAEEPPKASTVMSALPHPDVVSPKRLRVSSEWIANVDAQFAEALHSPIDDVRAKTLQNIIYVATFHGDLVTLRSAVSSLVDVYRLDGVEAHRLMAVQALDAIGDAYGMQRLREEAASQPSPRVRAVTEAALAAYDRGA